MILIISLHVYLFYIVVFLLLLNVTSNIYAFSSSFFFIMILILFILTTFSSLFFVLRTSGVERLWRVHGLGRTDCIWYNDIYLCVMACVLFQILISSVS